MTIESARLPWLHDLVEVARDHADQLVRFFAPRRPAARLVQHLANSPTSSRDSAEKLLTKLSGFLISWAMPAVSWPSEASFSDWMRRSCALRRSSSEAASSLRARLHLVEQAHVLDRDHRLVGEGLDDLDLPLGEFPRLGARQDDRALHPVASRNSGTPSRERTLIAERAHRHDDIPGPRGCRESARPCRTAARGRRCVERPASRDDPQILGERARMLGADRVAVAKDIAVATQIVPPSGRRRARPRK